MEADAYRSIWPAIVRDGRGHHVLCSDAVLSQHIRIVGYRGHALGAVTPHPRPLAALVLVLLLVTAVGKLDQQRVLAARQRAAVEHLDDLLALLFRLHARKTHLQNTRTIEA